MKDIDRKEIEELKNIRPPREAIELKLIKSFPTTEQIEAGNYLPQPAYVIRDNSGNYFISDHKANVIFRYDLSGNFIGHIGRPGQGPGDLNMPGHMKIVDSILMVYDGGNRRIQYFDFQGQSLKIVRMFRSFLDMVFLQDGRVVGAPSNKPMEQEKALVEILESPDGKVIRSFGVPEEFKYGMMALGFRKIFVNKNNEIIVIFTCLPIIQKYSMDGKLLEERRLKNEFSFQKEKINRRLYSYLPEHRIGSYPIFREAALLNDLIYVIDHVPPRLWIWEVNEKFNIQRTYFANVGEELVVRDFLPIIEKNQIQFIILGDFSDHEPKISIFAQ